MNSIKWIVIGVGIGLVGAPGLRVTAAEWEFPEDIPKVEPATPGLAGISPTDIVRFLMVRSAGSPALSPDGKWLAFRSSITGMPQLWVIPATGGWPRQLTFGGGITFHAWGPGDTGIIYGADRDGDEREGYHLISPDGTDERNILVYSDAYRTFGGFNDDGSQIIYSSTARNGRDFDVYVADTNSDTVSDGDGSAEGGSARMVFEGRFGYYARSWQPGGDLVIVSEARGEDANDLYLLDLNTGEMRNIFSPKVAARYSGFAWTPDGGGFFMATDQDREFTYLAHYDMAADELHVIDTPDADVGNVVLSGDGKYLAWTTNEGGYSRLHATDLTGGEVNVPDLPDGVYGLTFAGAAPVLAISISGPGIPGDIWSWDVSGDVAGSEVIRMTESSMAGLSAEDMVVPEEVWFDARDGVRLQGLLYMPKDIAPGAKPSLVMNVHGGPNGQARPSFRGVLQYLVGQGIAVIDVNVRGSQGFGKTYARLDNQEKRLDSVRDLVDILAGLEKDGRVNTNKAAVMGGSYGGYMVNAVLGAYPDAFAAGVSRVGVSDWVRALNEASPALKASDRIEYGDIREARWQEFYAKNSPINTAGNIKVPMLVEHGVNDPRDPVTESDRIVRAVRANGVEVTYLRFPDEGHGIRKLTNQVTYFRQVADFLERILEQGEPGS